MPGLGFLNPLLLWGLALGAIPILLHLLQRRRYRVRRWAAMEFLQASVRRSSRRLRIEQWLLLLVRTLILMLVALALSRPLWHSPRWGLGLGSRAAAQVVLVLDDSYSMGWEMPRDGSRYEWARGRAAELVRRGLTPGDSVSIVLASEPARALVKQPTFNLAEAAGQVQKTSVSDRRTDLASAGRLCLEILRSSRSAVREVYLFTDGQAEAWRRPEVAEAWRDVGEAARLHVIEPPSRPAVNLAVDEVRVGGPVAPGRRVPVQARVSNWGDRPAEKVVVTLHVDGRAVTSARASIPARGAADVRFEHAFATPGAHSVIVALPSDGLAADNRGYASVVARRYLQVLVLNGHPDPDPRRDAAFFLAAALAPEGAVMGHAGSARRSGPSGDAASLSPSASPFHVNVLNGNSFLGADLSEWDVVVLADVPRVPPRERQALANFVQDGGGLLVLPGPNVQTAFYNGDLLTGEPALLPARVGDVREAGSASPGLDIARADHPAFARFRSAADVDLSTARFERYYQLAAVAAADGARVVCRFTDGGEKTAKVESSDLRVESSDGRSLNSQLSTLNSGGGSPALVERSVGLGRVILTAFPLSPGSNTLPFKPAFLPFLHGLVAYLGQGPAGERNLRVGDSLVMAVPGASGGKWQLKGPDGSQTSLQPVRASGSSSARLVRVDAVHRAGLYRASPAAPPARPSAAADAWFAVNLRTDESDLRLLSRPETERLLQPAHFRWVNPSESLAAVVQEGRLGREAWRGLLAAVLVLMLCESGMAQLFGRRRS